jgi:aryl-alcohol dehydrogenase-like predicted oxidoreductase
MTAWRDKVVLGRTGLRVGKLGVGSSYGAPAAAYEEAFERGVSYFYWGTWRRDSMADAIRSIARRRREELVVVVQSYARFGFFTRASADHAISRLGLDYADVILLGWHNQQPSRAVIDAAWHLVERGRVRHVAISSHRRALFPALLADDRYAIWHVRYNAAHRGAEREVFPVTTGLERARRPGIVTYTTTRWGHLCDPARTPPGERTPSGTDCYRFALSHPAVDVALAGPADLSQMRQALDALERGPLDEEELAWMRRVGDHVYRGDRTSAVRDAV